MKEQNQNQNTAKTREIAYKVFGLVNFIRGRVLSVAAEYAVKDPNGVDAVNIVETVKAAYTAHYDITDLMWEKWGYPLNLKPEVLDRATEKVFESFAEVTGLKAVLSADELIERELNKFEVGSEERLTANFILVILERFLEPLKSFIEEIEL